MQSPKVSRKKFFKLFSFQRLIFLQKFPLETWNSVSTTLTNDLFLPKSWKLFAQILKTVCPNLENCLPKPWKLFAQILLNFKVSIVSKFLLSPYCSSVHVEYKIHVTPGNNLPKMRKCSKVIMFSNFFPRMFLWARKKAIFSNLPKIFAPFLKHFRSNSEGNYKITFLKKTFFVKMFIRACIKQFGQPCCKKFGSCSKNSLSESRKD